MTVIDFLCLGIGKGATYIMQGKPSSSFAIRVDNKPVLLVDCGAGIALSCLRYLDEIPRVIYITHNHSDHTGDLPIAIGYTKGKPRVLGNATVLKIVKEHRLHELTSSGNNLEKLVDWIEPNKDGVIEIGNKLTLHLFKSIHTYTCYGFILKKNKIDILGYTADCGFDENIYSRITQSPTAIIDGRDNGNSDHASLEEIDKFCSKVPNCSVWITHYDQTNYIFKSHNAYLLTEGKVVQLDKQ